MNLGARSTLTCLFWGWDNHRSHSTAFIVNSNRVGVLRLGAESSDHSPHPLPPEPSELSHSPLKPEPKIPAKLGSQREKAATTG